MQELLSADRDEGQESVYVETRTPETAPRHFVLTRYLTFQRWRVNLCLAAVLPVG